MRRTKLKLVETRRELLPGHPNTLVYNALRSAFGLKEFSSDVAVEVLVKKLGFSPRRAEDELEDLWGEALLDIIEEL